MYSTWRYLTIQPILASQRNLSKFGTEIAFEGQDNVMDKQFNDFYLGRKLTAVLGALRGTDCIDSPPHIYDPPLYAFGWISNTLPVYLHPPY
jgi:hypothetical protein